MKANRIAFIVVIVFLVVAWTTAFLLPNKPARPDEWRMTEVVPEGMVTTTAFGPDGTAYAGTYKNGMVYRSTDGCRTWQTASKGMAECGVRKIAVDSRGAIYAATGAGVYRSTDRGDHWKLVNAKLESEELASICIDALDRVYLGTESGKVFRSDDGGAKWRRIGCFKDDGRIAAIAVDHKGRIYAEVAFVAIFRSVDDGQHWIDTHCRINPDHYVSSIAIDSRDRVFASGSQVVLRSVDRGKTWQSVTPEKHSKDALYFESTAIGPSDVIALSSSRGVYESLDHGNTWKLIGPGKKTRFMFHDFPNDVWVGPLAVDSNGRVIAAESTFIFCGALQPATR